jgi:hypothetical protein
MVRHPPHPFILRILILTISGMRMRKDDRFVTSGRMLLCLMKSWQHP